MSPQAVSPPRRRSPLSVLISAILLSPFALAHAAPAHALPVRQAATPFSYTLVDRWTEAPWRLRPGHLRIVSDITVADDGTTFVLDRDAQAVHVMDAAGAWAAAFPVPPQAVPATRIDAAPDGSLYLLRRQDATRSIAHLDRGGRFLDGFVPLAIPTTATYADLAVGPDGRIYLGRHASVRWLDCEDRCSPACRPDVQNPGIDVFGADGTFDATFGAEDLWVAMDLDVDPSGVVYVVNGAPEPNTCMQMPTARPTATPRPSARMPVRAADQALRSARPAADGPAVDRRPSGVVVFGPDHRLRHAFPMSGINASNSAGIGASAAGAFVGHGTVYAITPAGLVPSHRAINQVFSLGVTPDGNVLTNVSRCAPHPAVGVATLFGDGRDPVVAGVPDDPRLEGPVIPIRAAAARQLAVLQDLYWESNPQRPAIQVPAFRYQTTGSRDHQTTQRWPRHAEASSPAEPASQLIACFTRANNGMDYPAVDIAADGDVVYTLLPTRIERRPNDQLPDWSRRYTQYAPPSQAVPHLTHIAASGGRVAVLDVGTAQVRVIDPAADAETAWRFGRGGTNAVPSDIALWAAGPREAHRVFLADRGRNRVAVYDAGGTHLTEWTTHDGPVGVAVGPTGDVFVLGRGGWGLRYTPAGVLLAYWRMPDLSVEARDIAVDDDGLVYVAYAQLGAAVGYPPDGREVRQGGVWVFKPEPAGPDDYYLPPDPERCTAAVDKSAAPGRLPLGNRVAVTLRVTGACPGKPTAAQVALVVDTSFSMARNHALIRAQEAIQRLLAEMDPAITDVALVTFGDGAALQSELTPDLPSIASTVLRLTADGDTRMAAGIDVALTELSGPRARRDVRRVMLLVTDGIPKDQPLEVAQAVRGKGIDLFALVFPSDPLTADQRAYLLDMVGAEDHFVLAPGPDTLVAFARALTRFVREPALFDQLVVTDVVPANMRYVPGSAVPPAEMLRSDTLMWTLWRVAAADPPVLRFEVVPQEVGTWPTNVEAVAAFIDITGAPGRLIFPVPEVEVFAPPAIYLPALANQACNPATVPFDVVLALDTSESMREPAVHGGTKIDAVRVLAARFAELAGGGVHRVGVVSFNGEAAAAAEITGDAAALSRAIAALATAPGTRIDLGLAAARDMLARGARPGARRVVVLLTDGRQGTPDGGASTLAAAAGLHAAGVTVHVIGLGADVEADLLRRLASSPLGYHSSPTTEELAGIARAITTALTCRWP